MKRLITGFMAVLMAVCILVPSSIPAQAAAAKVSSLQPGREYHSFDVTGDNRKDKVKIRVSGDWDNKALEIFVNGKRKPSYRVSGFYDGASVKVITFTNGKSFIYLNCGGKNKRNGQQMILRYTGGRFVKTVDLNALTSKHCAWLSSDVDSVSGNTVTVSVRMMNWTVGVSDYSLKFTYKDGKLVQNSASAKYNGTVGNSSCTFTVARNIKAYRTPGGAVAFTLRRGSKVKVVSQFRISSGRTIFRVKCGSRYGWIYGLTSDNWDQAYFSNVNFGT